MNGISPHLIFEEKYVERSSITFQYSVIKNVMQVLEMCSCVHILLQMLLYMSF